MATARLRTLPDFIIIGAQRCGTTSLYNYLAQHPSVLPAFMKETHFFDFHFHKGVSWYRAFFPPARRFRTAAGFSSADSVPSGRRASSQRTPDEGQRKGGQRGFITGESTPYYLFYPHAAYRIKETVPSVKLIVLLRNPVDRAYSHYHHEVRTGAETASFEDALVRERETVPGETARILEDGRYRSVPHIHHSYLSRGIYADQLPRWVELFGSERMMIVKSEDFDKDPALTADQVFHFLDLPGWKSADGYEKYNLAHYESMHPDTRARLLSYFEPHNLRLRDYLAARRIPVRLDWEN